MDEEFGVSPEKSSPNTAAASTQPKSKMTTGIRKAKSNKITKKTTPAPSIAHQGQNLPSTQLGKRSSSTITKGPNDSDISTQVSNSLAQDPHKPPSKIRMVGASSGNTVSAASKFNVPIADQYTIKREPFGGPTVTVDLTEKISPALIQVVPAQATHGVYRDKDDGGTMHVNMTCSTDRPSSGAAISVASTDKQNATSCQDVCRHTQEDPCLTPADRPREDQSLSAAYSDEASELGSTTTDPNQETSTHETTYSVSQLNPEVKTPWKFTGRILARNPVRQYQSWRGNGCLFEVCATDANGDALRATVFNDGVAQFYDILAPGTVCSFSNGRIKTANSAFARSIAIELTFGGDGKICQERDNLLEYPQPSFTSLRDIPILLPDAVPTIIGVITQVASLKPITTRKGKATFKRDFLLVDDSSAEIVCTVWGQSAELLVGASQGQVILLKDAQVSDYMNVRSVSAGLATTVLHQPAIRHSSELTEWFSSVSPGHAFTSLHG